jgi:hypothetical protein
MRRNLIYHISPYANYRWNLEQLKRRWKVFNGSKVIAIVVGAGRDKQGGEFIFESPEKVKELLPKDVEYLILPNNPNIRETATLLPLLKSISSTEKNSITFYGHTKGVTRGNHPGVKLWTELMYRFCLDHYIKVEQLLEFYFTVGCFKRYGQFKNLDQRSFWHYSGTFFWFKNAELFSRDWQDVPQTKYGTESYLSIHFKNEEAACIFGDYAKSCYNYQYLQQLLRSGGKQPQAIGVIKPVR